MYTFYKQRGGAVILVLVFAGIFVVIVGSILQFVLQQSKSGRGKVARTEALQIAEAGLEYYKWLLAHNPDSEWQGSMSYKDPANGLRIGEFDISVNINKQCGDIMSRDITVTGISDKSPQYSRTISARYMFPSVANYSYLIDSSVWAGSGRHIIGPYYASGGIRMDAVHNSVITSGVNTWYCDYSFGCDPPSTKNGVWGSGSNPELWEYPNNLIDFININTDLNYLKNKSISFGHVFSSVSGGAPGKGYRLVFKSDGTFDMYRVDGTAVNIGWRIGGIAHNDYHTITAETFLGNYIIPSDCSLIFVEDQLWVEGVVSGKVTVVVADLDNVDYKPNVILYNDITYADGAQSDGVTVITEGDIEISAKASNNLAINGIFVAPNGRFGRDHYVKGPGYYWDFGTDAWVYAPGVGDSQTLDTLTLSGTVVSKERTGTAWAYGLYKKYLWWYFYQVEYSGFTNRINSYERSLASDPPVFTPASESIPYLINWTEG